MSHWKPVDLIQDLVNQLGGEERIKRIQSHELVIVERRADRAIPAPRDDRAGSRHHDDRPAWFDRPQREAAWFVSSADPLTSRSACARAAGPGRRNVKAPSMRSP